VPHENTNDEQKMMDAKIMNPDFASFDI